MLLPACAAVAAQGSQPRLEPIGALLPQITHDEPAHALLRIFPPAVFGGFGQAAVRLTAGLGNLLPLAPYVQALLIVAGGSYFIDLT